MTEAEKEEVRIRAGLTQNEIAAYQSGLQERTMNLPNLTELLEKATQRPWVVEGGLQDLGERYITAQDGDITVGEVFHTRGPNARLLVLAANNFDAVVKALSHVTECQLCSEGTFFRCEHGVDVDALLAKIEREAGEL